jgi:hypothetical protein
MSLHCRLGAGYHRRDHDCPYLDAEVVRFTSSPRVCDVHADLIKRDQMTQGGNREALGFWSK